MKKVSTSEVLQEWNENPSPCENTFSVNKQRIEVDPWYKADMLS